ncbi:MAG: Winged helix DNA-binding protein [Segetibacter sp.]|nr:Winged helix DNA-binding protein [Segetibacter sp.]
MTINDIAKYRLLNQQLAGTTLTTPKEIVSHFGAMQSQDYAMSKWAIGIRLSADEKAIENAINNGEIIRTHILRPTWHFVSSNDIRWMLALTATHVKRALASMCRKLELTDETLKHCKIIIEKSLTGNNHLTREEIMLDLNKKGIATNDIRSALIMLDAELDGLVCNGPMRLKQFTYALLDERVSETKLLTRNDALAELAKRYFTSHGPASLQDFSWWSGLSLSDSKLALEMVKNNFLSIKTDNQAYWFDSTESDTNDNSNNALFLPAYDEFMVSYKDRSASLAPEIAKHAISGNGIFKPIIVVDGRVIGWWKRAFEKDKVLIETHYFKSGKKLQKRVAFKAAERYGNFVGMKTILQ